VQKLSHNPTRLGATFDDDRAVAGAGLALVATLSKELGTCTLANELIELGAVLRDATPGRKVLTQRPQPVAHRARVGLPCQPSRAARTFVDLGLPYPGAHRRLGLVEVLGHLADG
jgi:hypothetical protein